VLFNDVNVLTPSIVGERSNLRRWSLGARQIEGLIGMTGEALFCFPLFRGVLRHLGDRRVLGRARCSEHKVGVDTLIGVAESRIWGSEPGRALRAAFSSSWL
jgi:hypothetical protein